MGSARLTADAVRRRAAASFDLEVAAPTLPNRLAPPWLTDNRPMHCCAVSRWQPPPEALAGAAFLLLEGAAGAPPASASVAGCVAIALPGEGLAARTNLQHAGVALRLVAGGADERTGSAAIAFQCREEISDGSSEATVIFE